MQTSPGWPAYAIDQLVPHTPEHTHTKLRSYYSFLVLDLVRFIIAEQESVRASFQALYFGGACQGIQQAEKRSGVKLYSDRGVSHPLQCSLRRASKLSAFSLLFSSHH